MCGIVGLLSPRPVNEDAIAAAVASLAHRGPDAGGHWASADRRVLLGHRRLSIIDLSDAGCQPMRSPDGRLVLSFNGEIYNHLALRRQLTMEGCAPAWRGHSDTETLLAAISAWGLEATLRRCRGMWALALWDQGERRLWLARDRFGEKPLYHGMIGTGFAFASELKALRALPGFDAAIDPEAAGQLLRYGYIPAPRSIHTGISKLAPGTIMRVDADRPGKPVTTCFYDHVEDVIEGARDPIGDHVEALDALRTALGDAVALQTVADVPVGTFLSGGIDSSLVTALAARQSGVPVRSFTIGFDQAGFDEAPHARAVAAHLGTDHHELYVGTRDTQAVIPALAHVYDEPFGDYSQIPTMLVSRLAREHVTVALSGDGGDELFGGYNRHHALPATWARLSRLPRELRRPVLGAGSLVRPGWWNLAIRAGSGVRRPDFLGQKIQRMLRAGAQSGDFADFALRFLDGDVAGATPSALAPHLDRLRSLSPADQLMALDAVTYLPDDILVKVDRATMAVGLEGRMPFLDAEVARVAARIPVAFKIGRRGGKQILRELLDEMVPPGLMDRPKAGFTMPVGAWLRGSLRDWGASLVGDGSAMAAGLVDVAPYRALWAEHQAGRADHGERLWPLLMLEAWLRERQR